jgi:hypothetical protein
MRLQLLPAEVKQQRSVKPSLMRRHLAVKQKRVEAKAVVKQVLEVKQRQVGVAKHPQENQLQLVKEPVEVKQVPAPKEASLLLEEKIMSPLVKTNQ